MVAPDDWLAFPDRPYAPTSRSEEGCVHEHGFRVTGGDEGRRFIVGFADKVRDKVQVLRGRVKRNTGEAIGNPRLQAEGSADEVMDNLK